MPTTWYLGPPASWTLFPPQRGRRTFVLHAVIRGTEYAISLQGGLHAVFIGQDGRGTSLTGYDFLTAQDAQDYAEAHARS